MTFSEEYISKFQPIQEINPSGSYVQSYDNSQNQYFDIDRIIDEQRIERMNWASTNFLRPSSSTSRVNWSLVVSQPKLFLASEESLPDQEVRFHSKYFFRKKK